MSDETARINVTMVYLGKRMTASDKPVDVWYTLESPRWPRIANDGGRLDTDVDEGRRHIWKSLRPVSCLPGAIFTFLASPDEHSVYKSSWSNPSNWNNLDDRMHWSFEHEEVRRRSQQASLARKFAGDPAFKEAIRPLGKLYMRLSSEQRRYFLMMIAEEIHYYRQD